MAVSRPKKILIGCSGSLLLLVLGLFLAVKITSEPRPQSNPSPEADQLARRMLASVNEEGWDRTGAVSWSFRGKHQHLWDRTRHLGRITWDDTQVLINLSTRKGRVTQGGTVVSGAAAEEILEKAWAYWANDSFWLNPVAKAFDEGVQRSLVELEGGGQGLLVAYSSGGVTPGDAYLWILDDNARPTAWKMWVSIIPIGGLRTGWAGWIQLPTGAWIATSHPIGPRNISVSDVKGATTLAELVDGEDPFAPLFQEHADKFSK